VFVLSLPRDRDRVDEGLIVRVTLARRDGDRLPVGLGDELARSHVWNPDLERPQPLTPQALAVLTYSVAG
jgi:hypothetical protein